MPKKPIVSDQCDISYDGNTGTFTVAWNAGRSRHYMTPEETKKHFADVVDDMQGEGDLEDDAG